MPGSSSKKKRFLMQVEPVTTAGSSEITGQFDQLSPKWPPTNQQQASAAKPAVHKTGHKANGAKSKKNQ